MFVSGNLPTTSEEITSTTVWESRVSSSDYFKLARMPVAGTVSLFSPADFAFCTVAAAAAFARSSKALRQPSPTWSFPDNRFTVLEIRADQYGANIVPISQTEHLSQRH
jgi:hypothetical protein